MGTIPTPPTFTAGAVLTATQLNTLRDVANFWAAPPRVYAWASGATSLNNSTTTLIAFASEVYDIVQSGDSPMHDNTTNNSRLVVRTAGKYRISVQCQFASNATGNRVVSVRLNAAGAPGGGSLLFVQTQGAVSGTSTSVSFTAPPYPLSAGDYVEMFASQSSGGVLNAGGDITTYFAAELVAA
jgi:hypothetical protein